MKRAILVVSSLVRALHGNLTAAFLHPFSPHCAANRNNDGQFQVNTARLVCCPG